MKRTLIALFLSLCLVAAGAGCTGNAKKKDGDKKKTEKKVDPKKDKAEREKLAGELYTAMKMNDNFGKQIQQYIMAQQIQPQIGMSIQTALTPEQLQGNAAYFQQNVPGMIKDLEKKVAGILDEKTMKAKVFVPIYAKDLTVEDFQVLIEFYKTKTGQKFLKKDAEFRSAMLQKTMELMTPHTQKLAQEFTDKIKKDIEAIEGGGKPGEKPAESAKPKIEMAPPAAAAPAAPGGKKK